MKPITLEWIEKAEEDWHVMGNAYRARKNPAYNATCFHAQQCAEKYLKGRLAEVGIGFQLFSVSEQIVHPIVTPVHEEPKSGSTHGLSQGGAEKSQNHLRISSGLDRWDFAMLY